MTAFSFIRFARKRIFLWLKICYYGNMIKTYFKTKNSHGLQSIKEPRDGSWINAENIADDDLMFIEKITGLEGADLADILDPYELPRVERQDGNLLIFIRTPKEPQAKNSEKFLYTESLTIICTDKYFITLSSGRNSLVRSILDSDQPTATTQRSKLLIYILLKTSQLFTKEIRQLRRDLLKRQRYVRRVNDADIGDLVEDEEILNQYVSALMPLNRVLETISGGKLIQLFDDDNDLFEDMIISTRQSLDLCLTSIKSIKSLLESYQIIFTNRLNRRIQVLTVLTILLTIPTMVGGLYGMNVKLPLADNPLAFFYIISLIILLTFGFIWFYKKKLS